MILCMCIRFYTGLVANIYSFLAKITFIVFFPLGIHTKRDTRERCQWVKDKVGALKRKLEGKLKPLHPLGGWDRHPLQKGISGLTKLETKQEGWFQALPDSTPVLSWDKVYPPTVASHPGL